ncbi:MAG: hypothetical protein H7228_00975 [Polaromonas sp.]|nr:hypothetical protein [Polaromonas sp.]
MSCRINFGLETLSFGGEIISEVLYRAYSLSDFLTRKLLLAKYKNACYSRIVVLGDIRFKQKWLVAFERVLAIHVDFDVQKYKNLDDPQLQEYFIKLVLSALSLKVDEFLLPADEIKAAVDEFLQGGYVNRRLFKKRTNKVLGVRAELSFELTLKRFFANLKLINLSSHVERDLVVLETNPDGIIFKHQLNDFVFEGASIHVLDQFGRLTFKVDGVDAPP